MNTSNIASGWTLLAGGLLLAVAAPPAAVQQRAGGEQEARALWDSTFLSRRPWKAKIPAAAKAGRSAPPAAPDTFLGVTLWRVRRSLPSDEPGTRLLVHEEQRDQEWTPERMALDTPLVEGQRVRISLETAQAGYLYVIDREQYAGGSLGDPYLIFPTLKTRGGDNRVAPGTVVEIPAWNDDPPYLRLVRTRRDQVGEILTVLVTPQPLDGLKIAQKALQLTPQQVAGWERQWGAPLKQLEAVQQIGKPYTSAERQAAGKGQPLTPADAAPQTLLRLDVKPGDPVLVNVPLRLRK